MLPLYHFFYLFIFLFLKRNETIYLTSFSSCLSSTVSIVVVVVYYNEKRNGEYIDALLRSPCGMMRRLMASSCHPTFPPSMNSSHFVYFLPPPLPRICVECCLVCAAGLLFGVRLCVVHLFPYIIAGRNKSYGTSSRKTKAKPIIQRRRGMRRGIPSRSSDHS